MSELTPVLYRSLGLPIPEKGEKLPFNYNAITKEADGITDSNRDGKIDEMDRNGWIEEEELYKLVSSNLKYLSVQKKLHDIDSKNPFKITKRIRQHVANLKKLHYPKTSLKTTIIIYRSIIHPDESFKLLPTCLTIKCFYEKFKGLREAEGGLEVRYDHDWRKRPREFLPQKIMAAKRRDRIACCFGLNFLLVTFLRAAGIKAYIKMKPGYTAGSAGHVYVIAEPDGIKCKLDPVYGIFSKTDENGDEDRDGFAGYHLNKGRSFSLQGKLKKALEHYEIALEFKQDYAAALNNQGVIFNKQGKPKKAKECYEKALELEPRYIFALINLGVLLEKEGKLGEAKRCYDKILGFKSDYALAWHKKGEVLLKEGKSKEAKKCLDKAFELNPELAKTSKEIAFLK